MRSWLWGVVVVASIGLLERPSAATPVLNPTSHDFGTSEIGLTRPLLNGFLDSGLPFRFTFSITLAPDDGARAAVQVNITAPAGSPDGQDFSVELDCPSSPASHCDAEVYFLPHSPGRKSAALTVHANGHTAQAALSGVGVVGGKYTGTIGYQHTIVGGHGRSNYSVDVLVVSEQAFCKGTLVDVGDGGTQTTSLDGPGLFELRWNGADEYAFQFACPNPSQNQAEAAWAEAIESYQQQLKPKQSKATLTGKWSEPAPETDELNGVTGNIQMTWALVKTGP